MIKQSFSSSKQGRLKMAGPLRLELLRQLLNEEDYMRGAIQRLAYVLSNELMGITKEGGHDERKRRE